MSAEQGAHGPPDTLYGVVGGEMFVAHSVWRAVLKDTFNVSDSFPRIGGYLV